MTEKSGAFARARLRASWGLADQALSSATNFGLALLVARSVSASNFGAFSFVLAAYVIFAGLSQGIASGPLAVRYAAATGTLFKVAAQRASGVALCAGLVAGLTCIGTALLTPKSIGVPLAILGTVLPGLLLQDAWRFVFVAQGRPQQAALNDGLWVVFQAIGFGLLLLFWRRISVGSSVAVWGIAGNLAAAAGCLQLRGRPQLNASVGWLREHRDLATRYATEALVVRGSLLVALFSLSAVAGLAALGSLRAAQLLFSPLNAVYLGGLFVAVPEAVRALQTERKHFIFLVRGISLGSIIIACLWGAGLLFVPESLGTQLLGKTWSSAQPLVFATVIQNVAVAASMGPQVGLRALGAASTSLYAQFAYAGLLIAGTTAGAAAMGARGAAFGIAVVTTVSALIWWFSFQTRHNRQRFAHGAGAVDAPPGDLADRFGGHFQ